jgi:hypothetical protein
MCFAVDKAEVKDIAMYKTIITKLMTEFSTLLAEPPNVTPGSDNHCGTLESLLFSMQALNRKFNSSKLSAVECKMVALAGGWNTAIGKEYHMPCDAAEAAEEDADDDSTDTASREGSDASFALGQCHKGPVETMGQLLPGEPDTKTPTLSQLTPFHYRPWFETLMRHPWGNDLDEHCPLWFKHAFHIVALVAAGVSSVRRYGEGAFVRDKTDEKDRFMLEDQYQTLLTRLLRFVGKALAADGEEPLFEVVDARQFKLECEPLVSTGETDMALLFRGSRVAVTLELKLRFDKLKHLAQASGGGFALTAGLSLGTSWNMPTIPAIRPYVFIIAPFMLSRMQFTGRTTLCQDLVPEINDHEAQLTSLSSRLWASLQDLKGQLSATEQAPDNDTEGELGDGHGGSGEGGSSPSTPKKRSGPTTRSAKAALFSPLKTPTRGNNNHFSNFALGVGVGGDPFKCDDKNAKGSLVGRQALGELNPNARLTTANLDRRNRGLPLIL